jgi:CDP-glycerol glycerophosphotransferase (TagB/SpsB family)
MVLSYYIYKYPYKLIWHLRDLIKGNNEFVFYCADPLDYEMFLPIKKYLNKVEIVAKNKKTRKYLDSLNIYYKRMPVFPRAVIMARQMPYKFPVDKIVKFGFDHGLYQFKRWTSARNYNDFNIYFVSSEEQVNLARKNGITTTFAIGYPKLDKAFNGEYNDNYLKQIKERKKIKSDKKTVLFSSTWDVAGLSQIDKWIERIQELSDKYNVLATVHTWTKKKYIEKLKSTENIIFLEEHDITQYLMIADVFIGDYNSLIGEFCALDKPIITFKVPQSERTIPEIIKMIELISVQVENFDEAKIAIEKCLENPEMKANERREANKIMFLKLDGLAGKRAADKIKEVASTIGLNI